jgi:PAS domain S-box-containing protein
MKPDVRRDLWRLSIVVLSGVLCYGAAWLSTSEALLVGNPAQLWLPTGIALGLTTIVGGWAAIGAGLAAFAFLSLRHAPPAVAVTIGTIDALEAYIGAFLLVRVLRVRTSLDRVRDVIALIIVATLITFITATTAITTLITIGHVGAAKAMGHWPHWWWSHLSSDLILTPVILTWLTRTRRPSRLPRAELFALLGTTVVLGAIVLDSNLVDGVVLRPRPHFLFPLLIWTGLRGDTRVAALVNLILSVMSLMAWVMQVSPFYSMSDLQSFVGISSVTTLVLSAMRAERGRAIERKTAIQEAALDAIVTVDPRGAIAEFNPAAVALFEVPASEAIGRHVAELLVPKSRRSEIRTLLAWYSREAPAWVNKRVRYSLVRASGDEFPAEIALTRIQLEGETWFTGFVRDISSERAAEEARRESRELLEHKVAERTLELIRANEQLKRRDELLHQAQALAHLGSFDYDVVAGKLEWSEELVRILGRDPATFPPSYEAALECVHPDERDRVKAALDLAVASLQPFMFQVRVVRPDGSIVVVMSQGRVHTDDRGNLVRVSGYCQDITEREKAEETRHRLVHLVESSADAIFALSLDGKIESWNAAARRIFGYAPEEVVGRTASSILMPEQQAPDLERLLTALRDGQNAVHYELRYRRKDGSVFDAAVAMSVIVDHAGRVVGLSKVLRDISDQKIAEQRMLASLREKEVLLREIHHRVKNNLQVISSLLNLQMERVANPAARQALTESQSRIRSMALVHSLLYRAKDLAQLDFIEYLRTVVESLVTTYGAEPSAIETTVTGAQVQLDIDRAIACGLIVTELVSNALRHAFPHHRHGHIHVEVVTTADQVVLEVRDDGVGLPREAQRGAVPSFGLQIARTLTQQLDGTIELVVDRGTTAHVAFPLTSRGDA